MADSESNPSNPASGEKEVNVEAPNLIVRVKEEFEAIMHHKKSDSHHKETSGLKTNNSKENAPLDDVRAPNVFQRAKEEFEAIGQVLLHKKDSPTHDKRDETKVAKSKDEQEIPGSPQGMPFLSEDVPLLRHFQIKYHKLMVSTFVEVMCDNYDVNFLFD